VISVHGGHTVGSICTPSGHITTALRCAGPLQVAADAVSTLKCNELQLAVAADAVSTATSCS
jgi:hypothetical protein